MSHNHKDAVWRVRTNSDGTVPTEDVHFALLQDLRDELKLIRAKLEQISYNTRPLQCSNALRIPAVLDQIATNTKKPKPKRKKKRVKTT